MPKTKKSKRQQHHTGIALLGCFVIAAIAVTITLRQLALERRLFNHQSPQTNSTTFYGTYTATVPLGKSDKKTITISLLPTRQAIIESSGTNPKKLEGSWSSDSNNTIVFASESIVYAFSYNPTTQTLKILNPDNMIWGAATLTLIKNN